MKERHSIYSTVADPGEGPGGVRPLPLFLDQTEARRAKKHFFWRPPPPLSKDLDDRPPPLISRSGSGNTASLSRAGSL